MVPCWFHVSTTCSRESAVTDMIDYSTVATLLFCYHNDRKLTSHS